MRSAHRLLNGCLANGGLYIKIGQGVSAINHILPYEYTNTLKKLEVNFESKKIRMKQKSFRTISGQTKLTAKCIVFRLFLERMPAKKIG